jgi:hypothetical protein
MIGIFGRIGDRDAERVTKGDDAEHGRRIGGIAFPIG